MFITGTHFNYFQVCKRKLWLFINNITFEHTSDLVFDGKLIHENSYQQRSGKYQEIELDGIKVDYFDTRERVIHEIKKSNKIEPAHEWQLKYYIYVFEKNGIMNVSGILEYPTLRKKDIVLLSDPDREMILDIEKEILKIAESEICPPLTKKSICRNCSYFEFCYRKEDEE